jgi:hypothetical protein
MVPAALPHRPRLGSRVTEAIKRDLRRRSAVEPCIGHLKSEHPAFRKALRTAADFPYRAALQCRYALSSGGATGRHEGRSGGGAVKMREMPLRDASGVSGYAREDGRVMKDMFAYRVKSSKESKADWDLLRTVGIVSKEDVNFPLSQSPSLSFRQKVTSSKSPVRLVSASQLRNDIHFKDSIPFCVDASSEVW